VQDMSLLFDLLTLPVSGPVKGLAWIAEKIVEQADRELYDEESIRGQLAELEMRQEIEEISEEEYEKEEADLLARLGVARERRKEE